MDTGREMSLPRIVFPEGFSEQDSFEMLHRGYLSHATVEAEDDKKYPVYFVDPTRLQQDLLAYTKLGTPFFAEPGLIVLNEVTVEVIHAAVEALWKQGFFEYLRPIEASANG